MDQPPPPPQLPPAGWYADPAGRGGSRWWDGTAWAPDPPGPAPALIEPVRPRRRRPLLWGSAAAVLVVALVASVLATEGPANPPWPASIAPIAAFVAKDRGLVFLHTVPVHFLAPKVFDRQIAQQDRADTASQKAETAQSAAEYRALGLLGGAVNLNAAQTALDSGSILAYYDDQAKDVVVRGTALDPATQITLAHELTHTLQDQHFNLTNLENRADTADRDLALTSLVEGDAVLTQNDYAASLSTAQQQKANAEQNAGAPSSSGPSGPTHDSSYLDVSSEEPYVLGPDFELALYGNGGSGAVNRAFQHPPTTELDILNPAAYLLGTPTHTVAPPKPPEGTRRVGSPDSFGAFDLYLLLSGYMDARAALIAADGLSGGAYAQYRQDGRTCTRVALAGRTAATAGILASALTSWASSLPLRQAVVRAHSRSVTISACDPGKAATAGPRSLSHALDTVDERNSNLSQAYAYGVTAPQVALCVGDQALADTALLSAEQTANTSYRAPAGAVQSVIDTQTKHLITLCQGAHPPASP